MFVAIHGMEWCTQVTDLLSLEARVLIPVTLLLRPGSYPLFYATSFSETFSVVQGSSVGSPVLSFFHPSVLPFSGAPQVVLVVKNPPASVGDIRDVGSVPVSGRSPGGGHGNPLQLSCLEHPMDTGVWQATVHRVTKSWTQLKQLSMHSLF